MSTTLIPMAGHGKRYRDQGYAQPKPLVPVDDVPMVVKAVQDLPETNHYVFVVLQEHIEQYNLAANLKNNFPNAEVVAISEVTEGQADTCLRAAEFITQDSLLISACDNGILYDRSKLQELQNQFDCLVFTFRGNVTVCPKPEQYGWVKTKDGLQVQGTSVKKPVSSNPIEDYAIVGTFWFKEGNIFLQAAQKMMQENRRINNEFYVDECINDLVELGYKVGNFEVEKYICWGTPDDLDTYNYWKNFFTQSH